MRRRNSFLVFLFLFSFFQGIAQDKDLEKLESAENKYKDDLTFMVQSFQTMLNLLGDPTVNQQDKDQIISQSYLKYFDNDKVQIEDDLDPHRNMPINKNVQSYLQDIIFFYHFIEFNFQISEINKGLNDQDQVYYKVSLEERLEGENLYGQTLKEINPRFIEFNLNEQAQEFKIVSVYTTKLSEKEDMAAWWNELDFSWRKYFSDEIQISDSITFNAFVEEYPEISLNDSIIDQNGDTLIFNTPSIYASIKKIFEKRSLTIEASDSINNLTPLNKLTLLESLNFSHCAIDDVSPLRSTLSLRELDASHSLLNNLNDLQYLSGLKHLNIDNTGVADLSVAQSWTDLVYLSIANTMIGDLSFLSALPGLEYLNLSGYKSNQFDAISGLSNLISLDVSGTSFEDITIINSLSKLHSFHIDATSITTLSAISDSLNLEIIAFDNTMISDLTPLIALPKIRMIYCDNSKVNIDEVKKFISKKPGVIIIYETQSLQNWWTSLDQNLKNFIRSRIDSINEPPNTETLHEIIFTETADLSDQKTISSLEGFQELINLKNLNLSGTMVTDLSPISTVSHISDLDISGTPITDISPLSKLHSLQKLDIRHTNISNLDSIISISSLKLIEADSSGVDQEMALQFNSTNDALLIYQSDYLLKWWSNLSADWIRYFSKKISFNTSPSGQDLQELVNTDSLIISDLSGLNLTALVEFKRLKYLKLDHVQLSDLSPLTALPELHSLAINNGAINDVISIGKMTQLTVLDLSNTTLNDLSFISTLSNLVELSLASTAVENIKLISNLSSLEKLDLSNMRISKINYLNTLMNLKEVKLTNTDLSQKRIDSFKRIRPDVKVIMY